MTDLSAASDFSTVAHELRESLPFLHAEVIDDLAEYLVWPHIDSSSFLDAKTGTKVAYIAKLVNDEAPNEVIQNMVELVIDGAVRDLRTASTGEIAQCNVTLAQVGMSLDLTQPNLQTLKVQLDTIGDMFYSATMTKHDSAIPALMRGLNGSGETMLRRLAVDSSVATDTLWKEFRGTEVNYLLSSLRSFDLVRGERGVVALTERGRDYVEKLGPTADDSVVK